MNIRVFLLSIILFVGLYTNTHALTKNELPNLLNNAIQKMSPEKKSMVLQNKKVITFLNDFPTVFIRRFTYNKIDKITFNDFNISDNHLIFKYNKLNLLNKDMYQKKKELLREYIIKELIKSNKLNIDEDIQWYYIDTNLKWELHVKRNKNKINKVDLIDQYINFLFKKNREEFKYISNTNQSINIYYNYLLNNNFIVNNNTKIDLDLLSKSLIIRNVDDFKKYFKVTSYRYRSGYRYDPSYRKYNIAQVYNTIKNNKIVIYPKQTISFNQIYLKNDNWTKFKKWSIIMKWEVKKDIYWWGVCWAATWMYQWTLYNKYIKTNARNHSIWYNQYRASINGKKIYTPWLDATYYTNAIDFRMTNTWTAPIILINRIVNNIEENFSLSMTYVKDDKIKPISFKNRKDNCFTWQINWKYKYSCYKAINSEEKAKELEKAKALELKLKKDKIVVNQ